MNIVYAVKIFAALVIVLFTMRFVVGKGLREVILPADWDAGFKVIIGTLFVSCFSGRVPFFFALFTLWAIFAPQLFGKSGEGRLLAYALIACISPQFAIELKNVGPVKDVLGLNAYRILEIFILLPEAFRLMGRRKKPVLPSWLRWSDIATFGFYIYWMANIYWRQPVSVLTRECVALALDTILPYYVLSRACVQPELRRRVMSMILLGAAFQAFVGLAESLSRHFLYSQLQYLYVTHWGQAGGLMRGSWVRAQGAFPGPLALAVLLLFSIGLWFALKPAVRTRAYTLLGLSLGAGMLATFSRGPTLALIVVLAGILALRYLSTRKFLLITLLLVIVLSVSWNAGLGDTVIALVRGATGDDQTADFNVRYRQELLAMSIALIKQSPWWGVPNYLQSLESLRQGEGIIDLVNTYLVVALNVGMFGVALFLVPFGITLWKQASSDPSATHAYALRREGLIWLPLTLGIMAAVFTVSPVSIIRPILVWIIALAVARLHEAMPVAPRPLVAGHLPIGPLASGQ
jgi:hypothetical protein